MMDTDRQDNLGSPLIEDFLDCEKLIADLEGDTTSSSSPSTLSTPPTRTLKRLHIDISMTSTQYLAPGVNHSDRMGVDGMPVCSSGPAAVSYSTSEMSPYSAVSAVSSFNYPAAADPSLLTPVSSASSPPLSQRPPKNPRTYHSQTLSPPVSQVPTPPNTSKLYYGYEGPSNGGSSSPMTVNPAATEGGHFDVNPYANHHPSTPKSEVPPLVDPYLGSFAVSGGNDNDVHHPMPDYPYHVDVVPNGVFLGQQPLPHPIQHQRMPSDGQAPAIPQTHPPQFRPHSAPQAGTIEDLRASQFLGAYPSQAEVSPGRKTQPRKKPAASKKASRTAKSTPRNGSPGQSPDSNQDEPEEELELDPEAPEEEKYLFQLRKEYLSERGKGMWEEMKARYSERFQGNFEKACLQMKVSRAVARYGIWPKKEEQRLREAFEYVESIRYQLIISRMKENGGCRVWDWKPQHIEAKLIKMGLEEKTLDEKTGFRRRKKLTRRQASPPHSGMHPSVVGDWRNGLGLHHTYPHHLVAHPQQLHARPFEHMVPPEDSTNVIASFTSDVETIDDSILDQIYGRRNSHGIKEERDFTPESMDMPCTNANYDQQAKPNGLASTAALTEQQRCSERIARQAACEQLMQQLSRNATPYGVPTAQAVQQ